MKKKSRGRTEPPKHLDDGEQRSNQKQMFRFEDGRRFHNDKDAIYIFPNDDDEVDRLHSQHFLVRYLWQRNYLAPVDDLLKDEGSKILDLGCGGGSWLFDMATDFRKPTFIGVDISPIVPQGIKPRNVEFVQKNILEGLPFQDDSIDYVHQSKMVTAIPSGRWHDVIDEIVRVLKPGGYVELYEFSLKTQNLGPRTQTLVNASHQHVLEKGHDLDVNDKLQSFLEANGQVEGIVRKDLILSYGKSSGRTGQLAAENHTYAISFLRQPLSKILNITPEDYDQLLDDVRKEMPEYETFTLTTRVYGRKKIHKVS